MVTAQNVVTIDVLQVTAQQVVHTETEIPVQAHARLQIAESAVTVHVIHVQVHGHLQIVQHVRTVIDQNVVVIAVLQVIDQNVAMNVAQVPIVQPVAPTEIAIHVQAHARPRIAANVQHAVMVIDQNVVMIVVHRVIVQPVVPMEIVTPVQALVHLQIGENVVTVHATHVQVPIVLVAKIHTVAIAHAQAMIAMPVRLRVTANAGADQIVPEAALPMIAKNVHAVVLAKSA
jgi:hypothetical protein